MVVLLGDKLIIHLLCHGVLFYYLRIELTAALYGALKRVKFGMHKAEAGEAPLQPLEAVREASVVVSLHRQL